MRSLAPFVLVTCLGFTSCSDGEAATTAAVERHDAAVQEAAAPHPSVHPERCRDDRRPPSLTTPDADVVARTPWRVVLVGRCRMPQGDGVSDASFMEGSVGLPSDQCNGQSAPYRAEGRRFVVDPLEVSTTTADCGPPGPSGYLASVTSRGVARNGMLYLLDADDQTVFALEPTSAPGCVVVVPPNGRRLAPPGDPACPVQSE